MRSREDLVSLGRLEGLADQSLGGFVDPPVEEPPLRDLLSRVCSGVVGMLSLCSTQACAENDHVPVALLAKL